MSDDHEQAPASVEAAAASSTTAGTTMIATNAAGVAVVVEEVGANGTMMPVGSEHHTVMASPHHHPQYTTGHPGAAPGYEHDPNAFGAYYPAFPMQSYPVAPAAYYSDAGMSPVAYAQTPPLGPTGSVSPFPSQSPYLAPVGGLGPAVSAGGPMYQSPSASPSGSATAAQFYFYSQNHTSPFLHPVQMSPTLSAISSTPSSPRLSGCPSPNPSFNGSTGRGYARSNASRHAAYDMFVSAAGGASGFNAGLSTNVYIRGLPTTTTDEGLHAMCAVFGAIISSKAIIDQKTNECKGYGFVMYASEDQARVSINALNAKGFQASFAKESFSTKLKNLQDPNSTNIYVSNLPLDFDEAKMEELFLPYKIMSSRILRDGNGVSRGVGFARMESRESAMAVIQKFNGFVLPGSSLPLQTRFADSPAQKKLKGQIQRKRIWKGRDPNAPDGGTSPNMGFVTGPDGVPGVALPPQAAMQFYQGGPLPPPAAGPIYQNAGAYPGYTYVSPPQQVPYGTMQPATAAAGGYFPQQQQMQAPMFSVTNADGTTTQPMPASSAANASGNGAVNHLTGLMEQKLQLNDGNTPTGASQGDSVATAQAGNQQASINAPAVAANTE